MITAVITPSFVKTFTYRRLVAYTVHAAKDKTGPWSVLTSNYRASVSKIHTIKVNNDVLDFAPSCYNITAYILIYTAIALLRLIRYVTL